MKKTNIFGLVLILSTLLIGCAQPNMCADIPEVYTITCGNNVTANKTQAMAGEMITVEATPGTNQRVASIKQNDVNLRVIDNRATFEMPAGNVNVTAVFDTKRTITLSDTTNMKFPNMEGSTIMAFAGETINVEYRDGFTGYEVAAPTLSTGGTITTTDNGYSFVMPNSDVTFNTTFVGGTTPISFKILGDEFTFELSDANSNVISNMAEFLINNKTYNQIMSYRVWIYRMSSTANMGNIEGSSGDSILRYKIYSINNNMIILQIAD